jgi:hypothetical protein
MSAPVAVLPVLRGEDGVWEAMVQPVYGADDLDVRHRLDDGAGVQASVRVLGEVRTLTVFVEGDGAGVVRYDDALPG